MTRSPFRLTASLIMLLSACGFADEYQAEAALRPRSAVGSDGAYVIVTSDREHIRATRYDAEGEMVGEMITVDHGTAANSDGPEPPEVKNHSVAMDGDGNFVVAWEAAGESHDIHFRLFDKNGKHLAHRSYSNRLRPGVSMAANGEFLLTSKDFASRGQIIGERFDREGRPTAAPFPVSTGSRQPWASASALGKNRMVFVAFEERSRDSTRIRAVAIDQSEGKQLYGVGISNDRDQSSAHNPAVASGPNGEVAIVWEEIVKGVEHARKNGILAVLDAQGAFIKKPESITPTPLRFRDTNPKVRFNDRGQVVITYSAHPEEIAP
jgi:hypothetical protein